MSKKWFSAVLLEGVKLLKAKQSRGTSRIKMGLRNWNKCGNEALKLEIKLDEKIEKKLMMENEDERKAWENLDKS